VAFGLQGAIEVHGRIWLSDKVTGKEGVEWVMG